MIITIRATADTTIIEKSDNDKNDNSSNNTHKNNRNDIHAYSLVIYLVV